MTHADPTAQDVARFEDGLPAPRRYFAIFALLVTLLLVVLDGAIANVALPTITAELDAPTSQTVWVVTAYQLVLVMALLPMAFLGEAVSPATVLGFGVILSGFLLVQRESVARFVGLRGSVPAEAE